jgi:hypothetical protein
MQYTFNITKCIHAAVAFQEAPFPLPRPPHAPIAHHTFSAGNIAPNPASFRHFTVHNSAYGRQAAFNNPPEALPRLNRQKIEGLMIIL